MKYILTIILTLVVAVPVFTYAANGMQKYNILKVDNGGGGEVQKIYDHDEGVICYVYDGYNAGGISCLKD